MYSGWRALKAVLPWVPERRLPGARRLLCGGLGLFLLATLAVAAAKPADATGLLGFSTEERARILAHGPWPAVPRADAGNAVQARPAARAFGRRLFSDPRLSADGRVSCATCHVPALAFQDGLMRPVPRDGRPAGARNTPSLFDTAAKRWLGWDGAHDSVWAASLAPLLAGAEMGHTPATLAARVRSTPALRQGYRHALGPVPASDEALVVGLAKSLAAYQATLVSARAPFDTFRDAMQLGDTRVAALYPLAAQRGLRLFVGEARCSVCHAGPAFSNGEFADIGVPFFVPGGVDPGRHAGLHKLLASRYSRLGPFNDGAAADPRAVSTRHVFIEHRHFGEFRVPGLRQLSRTAPYMHDGSLPTLQAVVQHYAELNEERLHADGERILRRLDLTAAQSADLVAFLRSLSP